MFKKSLILALMLIGLSVQSHSQSITGHWSDIRPGDTEQISFDFLEDGKVVLGYGTWMDFGGKKEVIVGLASGVYGHTADWSKIILVLKKSSVMTPKLSDVEKQKFRKQIEEWKKRVPDNFIGEVRLEVTKLTANELVLTGKDGLVFNLRRRAE